MRLQFIAGPDAGREEPLKGDCTLGRDAANQIVVQDQRVSLVHCLFVRARQGLFVKDLGSTNGTSVNGQHVAQCRLKSGDTLQIGDSTILVLQGGREGAARAPAETIRTRPEDLDAEPAAEPGASEGSLPHAGSIVDRTTYHLKRLIAEGGMGAIYEAEQLGAEGFIKTVALKIIRSEYARTESFVAAFIGEAKLVARLAHQNIVQIYQLGRWEDAYYIAMEYIDGIDLTHFMFRHAMLRRSVPVEIATYIVSRVCRGLEYAHMKRGDDGTPLRLVHRDVSPNNIMITQEGEVKLADFGVAQAERYMQKDDGDYIVGNPQYMAPEQARCEHVDGRSDIYSLGAVFYELLTGAPALGREGDDSAMVRRAMAGGPIAPPARLRPDLAEEVAAVVMRCLAAAPENRYATAGELGYALEFFLYRGGYGPTIVTLANYVAEIFPEVQFYAPPAHPVPTTAPTIAPPARAPKTAKPHRGRA